MYRYLYYIKNKIDNGCKLEDLDLSEKEELVEFIKDHFNDDDLKTFFKLVDEDINESIIEEHLKNLEELGSQKEYIDDLEGEVDGLTYEVNRLEDEIKKNEGDFLKLSNSINYGFDGKPCGFNESL